MSYSQQDNLTRYKYPRTFHLPWSQGLGDGDDRINDTKHFECNYVVCTLKMDGENTTIYSDGYCHARSIDSRSHPSRSYVRRLAGNIAYQLPYGWRIVGESLQVQHSIEYLTLPDWFMPFAMYNEQNVCLSWVDFVNWCSKLHLKHVPLLYVGIWDEEVIRECVSRIDNWYGSTYGEGYVVRLIQEFPYQDHNLSTAKWVRKNHIQKNESHWFNSHHKINGLSETNE